MTKMLFAPSILVSLLWTQTILSARPNCPNAENLSPCTCDLEGISCNWVIDADDLKRSLQTRDADTLFRNFWMVESSITKLHNDTFKFITFRNIYLPNNKIESIQSGAFQGLENTCKLLELQSNKLRDIPLAALKGLKLLETLVLAKNHISNVREGAFEGFLNLFDLRLEGNQIITLGAKAFDAPTLRNLNLSNNKLKKIGELAFFGGNKDAVKLILDLSYNEIEDIAQNAFEGREETLGSLTIKGNGLYSFQEKLFGSILKMMDLDWTIELDLSSNMILCDQSMQWILQYKVETRARIKGIMCLKNGVIV